MSIFQDGRRLVLILFLIFAALWAQIDFVNLLIPTTQSASCQGLLGVTTALDQLARVAMEQFLLWSVGQGTKLTAERLILQVVLLIRLVAGGILVGMTRPQFAPLCLARTSLLPVGIVVLALDAVIIIVLLIRALLLGNFGDKGFKQRQSKALICAITGLAVWTGVRIFLHLIEDNADLDVDKCANDTWHPNDHIHPEDGITSQRTARFSW